MQPGSHNLEETILKKFPAVCSYCFSKPCGCWRGEKPTIQNANLRDTYYKNRGSVRRSTNDFQAMFSEIYGLSWVQGDLNRPEEEVLRAIFIRLIEEVAEVGEAIRFHHLYPENFESEIADVMAWWFALVSSSKSCSDGTSMLLVEDCLWRAYPGHCLDCLMLPCLCRPGPVRQLMSRPIPGYGHRFDGLTSLLNQAAYNEDIKQIGDGARSLTLPIACARLDVDHFKQVNDTYGHNAGDEALRHIASIIRRTVRERDSVYRVSGDEFGVLCANYTEEEAAGVMRRVCNALAGSPVRWVSTDGIPHEFTVSVSVGVSECHSPGQISSAFEQADAAAYKSKKDGRARVTRATSATSGQPFATGAATLTGRDLSSNDGDQLPNP